MVFRWQVGCLVERCGVMQRLLFGRLFVFVSVCFVFRVGLVTCGFAVALKFRLCMLGVLLMFWWWFVLGSR